MKPTDIQVGKTYRNRGKGRTRRRVIDIDLKHRPTRWYGSSKPPYEPGVLFVQLRCIDHQWTEVARDLLYLSSFAAWASGEVDNAEPGAET